tara:strand:+ start:1774 stop:2700 length:927 start_codon:yes stop_codon:yes gene_type:complete
MPADRSARTEHNDPLVAKLLNARESAFIGAVYPIYLEPLVGSGERWTICIAIVGLNGQVKVINTINNITASKCFGSFGEGLFRIANETAANLKAWLNTGTMNEWEPLFSETQRGDGRPIRAKDIDAAVRIATKTLAVFMAKTANEASNKDNSSDNRSAQWESNVKEETLNKQPKLRGMFGRTIPIKHQAFQFSYRFGFVGGHAAVNFANFNTSNLAYAKSAAESDLMHLEQLRSYNDDQELIKHNTYELMIYTPINIRDVHTKADTGRILASIDSLVAFGDKHEISVINLHSPQDAAQRIIKRELSPG